MLKAPAKRPAKKQDKYTYDQTLIASTSYFKEKLPASVWTDKYAMRDSDNNLLELTPDDMHDRLASEFARIDAEKYGLDYDIRYAIYREALHQFARVVPQGSPMCAIGNTHQIMSASNCVVVESPEDSIAGIMKTGTELAQLYKRRAGVGVDISTLRPDGFKVNNAARQTSGAWSFADFFSYITRMIAQKGRRGALMLTMDVHHPDVINFATMKADLQKVTGANVSVRLSDAFLKAVDEDAEYEQYWPMEGQKQYSKMVKARDVWKVIIDMATKHAEPGLIFWDKMTQFLPAHSYKQFRSRSTNPCCFAQDSKAMVTTKAGIKEIKQITAKDEVWIDSTGEWAKCSGYFKAGIAPVYRVTFSNQQELFITDNHKLEKTGFTFPGLSTTTSLVELKDLKVGDMISADNRTQPCIKNLTRPDGSPYEFVVITSIEYVGNKPVGCIEVEKYRKFTANGIISGNSEISLSAYDSCRLISLNLTGYVRDAFIKPSFNWDLFKSDVKLATQMCDNLVDLELELIEKIKSACGGDEEKELWQKLWQAGHDGRRTGLGTHGVADALAQMNIKYDSEEALDLVDQIYSVLCHTTYETSTELAKVRGSFPAWDWAVDKDNKFIQSLPDWLQAKIKKDGRRNIAMLTQAPTGSVSIVSKCGEFERWNVSSGVEPVFRNFYIRRKKINPSDKARIDYKDAMGDTWQEFPVFHPNVKNYLEKVRGYSLTASDDSLDEATVQKLKEEKLPDFFTTSDQIDWKYRIKLQGNEQQYIDHSISSCITAGQLVHTSQGLMYIEDLVPKDLPEKSFGAVTSAVSTKNHLDQTVSVDETYNNGSAECVEVKFDEGHSIKCTKNHKLMTLNEEYQFEWQQASDLKDTDYVVCRTAMECFGDSQKIISSLLGPFESPLLKMKGNTKEVTIPKRMTKELARLLGYLVSDGFISENGFGLSQVVNNVCDDFINLVRTLFDVDVSIVYDKRSENLVAITVNSRILRDYFEYLGLTHDHGTITVPKVIFQRAGRGQCAEFLKGVTLDGYVVEEKLALHTTISLDFAKGTLALLNQFGISANFMINPPGEKIFPGGKVYKYKESYTVYCGMDAGVKFIDMIGFAEDRKTQELQSKFKRPSRKFSLGSIPNFGLREAARLSILPKIKSNALYNIIHSATSRWKNEFDLSRETVKMFCDFGFELPNKNLLDDTYIFRKVKEVSEIGLHQTYDLHIKDGNSYLVNDIVSHNTINLPKGTTSDTVGSIYLAGWKNGLKGLTVYVDGCRDGVLISDTDKIKKIDPTIRPEKIVVMSAPKRPKTLPCDIHQVTVDGKRWTTMVGLLHGVPYEVFLGYSEQLHLPTKIKTGNITKTGKGKYQLHVGEGDDELIIKDIINVFDNPQSAWATRLLSMSLRHGISTSYLSDVLSKDGKINDINRVIARVLKKYIPEGEKVTLSTSCTQCQSKNLKYQEGCISCADCGYAKCN